jgi:hypothetical protein
MGEKIMNTIRLITHREIQQVLDLAYKAVFERGWVTTDFDKQHFNIQVKNTLIHHNNHCIGMFRDDKELVGFAVAQIDQFIWNTEKKCHIDLVHLDQDHRHPQYYQLIMDSIMAFCKVNNIKYIRTSRSSWLLPELERMDFLHDNRFFETDSNWDWQNEN